MRSNKGSWVPVSFGSGSSPGYKLWFRYIQITKLSLVLVIEIGLKRSFRKPKRADEKAKFGGFLSKNRNVLRSAYDIAARRCRRTIKNIIGRKTAVVGTFRYIEKNSFSAIADVLYLHLYRSRKTHGE